MQRIHANRIMLASEIPAFVAEVVATGCDICAIGDRNYVVDELEDDDAALERLNVTIRKFGSRDLLIVEIAAYLRSLGRYIDRPTADDRIARSLGREHPIRNYLLH